MDELPFLSLVAVLELATPSSNVMRSTGTMQSACPGSDAPVMISMAWPASSVSAGSPAACVA